MSFSNDSDVEEFNRFRKGLIDYLECKPYGVDRKELVAFANNGKTKWQIKPDAHVNPIRLEMIKIRDELIAESDKQESGNPSRLEMETFTTDINKRILELGLENFDYEKEASNPDIGPDILDDIAMELVFFLVGPDSSRP